MLRHHYLVNIVLQAVLAIVLTRTLGPVAGSVVLVLLLLACSAVGFLLMTQIQTGAITWRNRVMGLLMPWPFLVGGGSTTTFAIKNAVASIVFAAIVIGFDYFRLHQPLSQATSPTQPTLFTHFISYAAVLCWIGLFIAWAWVLRIQLKEPNLFTHVMKNRSLLVPLLVPPIVLTLSIVFRYQGLPVLSLGLVAIPMLLALAPVLMVFAMILAYSVSGKPMRWN